MGGTLWKWEEKEKVYCFVGVGGEWMRSTGGCDVWTVLIGDPKLAIVSY